MVPEPIAGVAGYRRLALGSVGSTNDEAFAQARCGDPGKLWVTATRQTAGRARRGRNWVSEPGNLYASLLLIDPAPMPQLATLPLVAALAVYRALKPLVTGSGKTIAIKWPNDILLDGAKINGILLESQSLGNGTTGVVAGCGINCKNHPEEALYPTTSLAEAGIDVTPDQVFAGLAKEMAGLLAQWDRGGAFTAIRRQWIDAAAGIGDPIKVNLADGCLEGLFEDIDADGCLSVRLPDGNTERVSAGDLFFSNGSGIN